MRNNKPKRKAQKSIDPDEILPEYVFSKAKPNKFAARIQPGSTMVILDPDIAAMFPNPGEVNEALRALLESFAATAVPDRKWEPNCIWLVRTRSCDRFYGLSRLLNQKDARKNTAGYPQSLATAK